MKSHYSALAKSLGAFAEQTIMPSATAETTTSVVRPPSYMGAAKTCAAHTGITVKGVYGDVTTNGAWTAATEEGEAMVMMFPSMGNMISATYGKWFSTASNVATLKLASRFRSTLKTLRIGGDTQYEYRSARPMRVTTAPDLVVHARPDDSGRWVFPINTFVGANALNIQFDASVVRCNDPVFADTFDLVFYYRNVVTGVWASVVNTSVLSAFTNTTTLIVLPATINLDLWYFTIRGLSGADFSFDYTLEFLPSAGIIQANLPPVANVQQIIANPLLGTTDAGWDVQAAAFISGSVDVNCTASDLQNGGNIISARLGQNEFPTQFLSQDLLSTVVDSYAGHFKSGSYGWLLPDYRSYTERDSNHVDFDQGLVFILRADTRGGYQTIAQIVFQGMSKSPLYEYRPPANIPNFGLLLEQLRLVPPVMDNSDHLKFLKRVVSSVVDVVSSETFTKALEAGDAVLKMLPNGTCKLASKVAMGAAHGANEVAKKQKEKKKQKQGAKPLPKRKSNLSVGQQARKPQAITSSAKGK